ncbi:MULTISPECIES: hypothetical protein [Pseudomonas]|uniref:hypothetical protein n=1 Tax=Pseudomonas TaxID=286 RepID=UPI00290792F1|nr:MULTISPECIES: hypothetical protein [Pseudomonas]MDU8545699.1 hypothetical protein [Pseudomonas syringae group sp. J248-6]WPP02626.1 hypothetical protein SFA35_26365 [Pseudomonas sp. HR96]
MTTTTRTAKSKLTAYIAHHDEWLAVLICALTLLVIPHALGNGGQVSPELNALCEWSAIGAFIVAAVLASMTPPDRKQKHK